MNNQDAKIGRKLALTGAWLQLGSVIGVAGTVIGMIRAFNTLSASGTTDPQNLSAHIGGVLIATGVGMLFSTVGLVLLFIALFSYRYRAEWFFWFLVIYGAVLLMGFPLGTAVGAVFLIYCLTHKEEFLRKEQSGQTPDQDSPGSLS